MFVKVCGLRTEADVEVAVSAGADAVGFVFAESPRTVDVATARRLLAAVPPNVLAVGVFARQTSAEITRIAQETDIPALQLHGDYPPDAFVDLRPLGRDLIRATTHTPTTDLTVGAYGERMLLLDSPRAGSGERWDTTTLGTHPDGEWLLAGGLTPDNVAHAIQAATPWGVDVSSGVESTRGVKDHARIRDFVAAARA